jgi:hypothetical protein
MQQTLRFVRVLRLPGLASGLAGEAVPGGGLARLRPRRGRRAHHRHHHGGRDSLDVAGAPACRTVHQIGRGPFNNTAAVTFTWMVRSAATAVAG